MRKLGLMFLIFLLGMAGLSQASPQGVVYLSDLEPVSVYQQWGSLGRDVNLFSHPLKMRGTEYPKGLGTHAYSKIVYDLSGMNYDCFEALIGIDDSAEGNGSVDFLVYVDGVKTLDSGLMLGRDTPIGVKIPVQGASELRLEVTDGGDGIDYDHADWVDAKLVQPDTLEELGFEVLPRKLIWETKEHSQYLIDLLFSNWGSPLSPVSMNVATSDTSFPLYINEVPFGLTRSANLGLPRAIAPDSATFTLRWPGGEKVVGTFLPPATWARASGSHISLEVQANNYVILNDPLGWIEKLDSSYVAYEELVGGVPYGGEMITILEVLTYPGGWAVAGNPIKWYSPYIADAFRQVNWGDWLFGILHEISHDFDLDYKWVWEAEFFANFKMVYAAERMKAKIKQGGYWFDYSDPAGLRLEDYYRWQAEATGEEDSLTDWFHHNDAATDKFLKAKNLIGWEPFKETFRTYGALPWPEVPSTPEGKLNLFVHYLEVYSGQDLVDLFRGWGFPVTGLKEEEYPIALPLTLSLDQNCPNPFNSTTLIRYQLSAVRSRPSAVTLKIYNIAGQLVRTLVDGPQGPGYHTVSWDGSDSRGRRVASGVYIYRLASEGVRQLRRMVLLR